MAKIDVGKVAVTYNGDYDSDATYEKLSIVNDNGVLYLSKKKAEKKDTDDDEYWTAISSNVTERFFGSKDEDPDSKSDGSDLDDGDMYYNTNDEVLKIYNKDNDEWEPISNLNDLFKDFFTNDDDLDLGDLSKDGADFDDEIKELETCNLAKLDGDDYDCGDLS